MLCAKCCILSERLNTKFYLPSERRLSSSARRASLTRFRENPVAMDVHRRNQHVGPATMQTILSGTYCILGACQLAKSISRSCVISQRFYARTTKQVMAPLPSDRVTPSPPFSITGLDFAGPLTIKRGNARKPVRVKCYVSVFLCVFLQRLCI